ncbi:ATP-dependent DNA ligase [Agrobacterium sp. CG674]
MDAYEVARLIEDIGATSSRGEKENLVKQLAESEIGLFVIKWAYDPFITFGITAAPTQSDDGRFEFRPSLVEPLLKKLASRELSGMAAEREIGDVMRVLNADGARLLFLILSKDLKCGIGENTINSAVPGTIPTFAVQRAITYEPKRFKTDEYYKSEFKLDGNRNTFLVKDGNGGFFTRSGKRVAALDFLVPIVIEAAVYAVQECSDELRKVMDPELRGQRESLSFMLDGEAMMGLFEDTGALRRKGTDAEGAELHLYDMMSYEDFNTPGAVGEPLEVRRKWLTEFVQLAKAALSTTEHPETIQIVPQFFVNSDEEVQALFQRARSMTLAAYLSRGNPEKEAALLKVLIDKRTKKPVVLEGIVVKNMKAKYEKRKSAAWMKVKNEETKDLRVTGAYPGKPHTKYENALGGANVDHEGVNVDVGGGWSDEEREDLWAKYHRDMARIAGHDDITPAEYHALGCEFLGRLIEVEYMEVTPDGSLRHPRFIRFRDDKDGEVDNMAVAA